MDASLVINPQIRNSSKETRMLAPGEILLLHNDWKRYLIFAILILCMSISIGLFVLMMLGLAAFGIFLILLLPGILFSLVFFYNARIIKKDEMNGIAEIIRGKLTEKGFTGRGGTSYLRVDGRFIPIESAFLKSIEAPNITTFLLILGSILFAKLPST